jgi:flagellar protein FliS
MYSTQIPTANPRSRSLAGAYQSLGVHTAVSTATPHALVTMLFDGFVVAVHRARGAIRTGDVEAKCLAISHAIRIIDEGLKSALDLQAGGKLAQDLSDLYAYVCMRLMQGNLRSDEAALEECLTLIRPLGEAWAAIGKQVNPSSNT